MNAAEGAAQIAADVRSGRRRAAEVCREALERARAGDGHIRAFIELCDEHALQAAEQLDAAIAAGAPAGPLAGVPVAVKDNICTSFGRTTCASRMLADYRSPYSATAVERIEAAGGIIIGKTNLDEFAMGSSTENSSVGATHNPWSAAHVPGGTSGGSAAAVAAGFAPVALGSDTGGSIRQPASFCGVTGFKPTYGRVSRYGLVAHGSSLDQIGPLTVGVADAALVLGVIAGNDARDGTSAAAAPPDYRAALADDALAARAAGLRIGVPQEYFAAGLDPEVRSAVEAALRIYERLGARLVSVSMPQLAYAVAVYYVISTAEASSNLARFDGVHYGRRAPRAADLNELYAASRSAGLGAEVKRRIMLGTFALSSGYYDAYYRKALQVRRLIQQDFERVFVDADVIAAPVAPTPAFRFGAKSDDPLEMYLADIYTVSANLAGVPAISIPCGFSTASLPIGLQLMAPLFGETLLFQAARLYERETDWRLRRPPVTAIA